MIQDFLIIKNMNFVFQNLVKANALARIRQIFTYEIFTEQVNGNINITGSTNMGPWQELSHFVSNFR